MNVGNLCTLLYIAKSRKNIQIVYRANCLMTLIVQNTNCVL